MLLLKQNITGYLSTNVEQPFQNWLKDSTYNAKSAVIYKNHIYQSIVDNNKGVQPDLNTGKWLLQGVDNAFASIDLHSNTKSICNVDTIQTDIGRYDFTAEFSAVGFTMLAFRGVRGEDITITELDSQGGTLKETVYPIAVYRTCSDGWYNYYFCEIPEGGITDTVRDLIHSPIQTQTASIRVKVTQTVDEVSEIASMVGGKEIDVGETQFGAKIGIIDYSKKETDELGITTLLRRSSRETLDLDITLPATKTQIVKRAIKEALGEVQMFIGDPDQGSKYEHLTILAYIEEFELLMNNGAISRGYISLSEVL